MGHGGPLVPVILREGRRPLWAVGGRLRFPPLILRTRRMKRFGGGDVHRSSPQPSFSCRGSYARAAATPWVRVGAEGVHGCMVVSSKQNFEAWW